ncbi:MAG: elongation factor P [Candidatus Omnitrophica bacterium]|nr:elongation factor P [Candidatus Omnitrophota bacterium]
MPLSINQLKTGLTILLDNTVYQIIEVEHVKPGKGAAFVRTKLKNFKNGTLIERTFKGDDKINEAFIEEIKLQYLYKSEDIYHFINHNTFEEISLSEQILGEKVHFLKDNLEVTAMLYKGEVLNINLPNFIELEVVYTEEGIKGDTVKAGNKSATLETGLVIEVPLFIKKGDIIKVDTRTKEYIERIST